MSPKHSFRPSSKLLRRSKELLVRNWMHSNSSGPGPACGEGNNRDTDSCPGKREQSVSVFTHLGSRYKGSSLTAPSNRAGNVVLRVWSNSLWTPSQPRSPSVITITTAGAVGLAYYLGQRHAGMTLRELGKYMGEEEYPAVSVAIARFQNEDRTLIATQSKTDREIVES